MCSPATNLDLCICFILTSNDHVTSDLSLIQRSLTVFVVHKLKRGYYIYVSLYGSPPENITASLPNIRPSLTVDRISIPIYASA